MIWTNILLKFIWAYWFLFKFLNFLFLNGTRSNFRSNIIMIFSRRVHILLQILKGFLNIKNGIKKT